MIFVTVGSQKFSFDRLIKKVDQMIREHLISEKVFMQTGAGCFAPCCSYQAFYQRQDFARLMASCDILITHGGAGTMIEGAKRGKKIIAVPRLSRYGEHVDDHQTELTNQLHEMKLVYACPDTDRLPEALEAVKAYRFHKFHSNTDVFLESLEEYIRSTVAGE